MSIPTEPNLTPAQRELAAMIDHTLLKPEAARPEVERLCAEAKVYGFASVCVNTFWVPLCAELLKGSNVKVCTVVGFPLGAMDSRSKAFETREAVARGAQEVDMVINVGAIKSDDWATVEADVRGVVEAAGSVPVKVILETGLLTDDEKVRACKACVAAGAAFVKTSTGFSKGGATEADIALMRATVGAGLGVKASGGVRTLEDARKMVAAGASRIGASSGIAIVTGGVGSGY